MKKLITLMLLLYSGNAFAQCVEVDTTSWTNRQKSLRPAAAMMIADDNGQSIKASIHGDSICFDPDATFDINTAITASTLTAKIQAILDETDAQLAQRATLRDELRTITQSLESDDTNWSTMTTAQRLSVAKKLLRRDVIKNKLGVE